MNWKDYQERAADFFRSLGLEAETDVTIVGVRTAHDVDVLVTSQHVGFEIRWIIECKHWKTKVNKLHVLALREIVSDTGSDRGIILAENGFQSGAIEAAALTNVHVTSLSETTHTAGKAISSMRLREIYDRLMWCKDAYWDTPKIDRVENGLRPEPGVASGYSGDWSIKVGEDLLSKGFRGIFPITPDELHQLTSPVILEQEIPLQIESLEELVDLMVQLVENLEKKISLCNLKNGQ